MSRFRMAFVVVVALFLVGLLADAASAHVTVSSTSAQQGGYATVTFQMPCESATASSVKLQVDLPTDTPFASVAIRPHPGWNYVLTKGKLPKPITTDDGDQVTEAITSVTWTAVNGGVRPGEFDEFDLSVGPLPTTDAVHFDAIQTYSDGTVVRWTDPPTVDGAESEHPAPTLALAPAGATSAASTPSAAAAPAADSSNGSTLAVIALIVAILGLLAGAGALVLTRRAGSRAS
jgi:uncharacterized protein YcnI